MKYETERKGKNKVLIISINDKSENASILNWLGIINWIKILIIIEYNIIKGAIILIFFLKILKLLENNCNNVSILRIM